MKCEIRQKKHRGRRRLDKNAFCAENYKIIIRRRRRRSRGKKQTHHVRGGFQREPRANANGKHVTARHDDRPSPSRSNQKYTIIIHNRSGRRFTEFQARPLHRQQQRTYFGRNSQLLTTNQSVTPVLPRYKTVFFISHAVRKKSFRSVFHTHVK